MTIRIWNLANGKEIKKLEGHQSRINSVAYSPDGKFVASCSEERTIRIWNLEYGKEVKDIKDNIVNY